MLQCTTSDYVRIQPLRRGCLPSCCTLAIHRICFQTCTSTHDPMQVSKQCHVFQQNLSASLSSWRLPAKLLRMHACALQSCLTASFRAHASHACFQTHCACLCSASQQAQGLPAMLLACLCPIGSHPCQAALMQCFRSSRATPFSTSPRAAASPCMHICLSPASTACMCMPGLSMLAHAIMASPCTSLQYCRTGILLHT